MLTSVQDAGQHNSEPLCFALMLLPSNQAVPNGCETRKKAEGWFKWYLDTSLGHFGQHHCVFFSYSKCAHHLVHKGWILATLLLYGMFQVPPRVAHSFVMCIVTKRERPPSISSLLSEGIWGVGWGGQGDGAGGL